jgi:hypothetical protein
MLIPFEVDCDDLSAINCDSIGLRKKDIHGDLLNIWKRIGVLVYNGASFQHSELVKVIHKLPPEVSGLWMAALDTLPRLKAQNPHWDGRVSKTEATSLESDRPIVRIIDETRAYIEFDVPADEDSLLIPPGNLEIVKLPFCSRSAIFLNAVERSGSHMLAKESFKAIWQERFHWLAAAENINHVAIMDRYAQVNCCLNADPHSKSGLERFLSFLNNSATSRKNVTLFCSWGRPSNDSTQGVQVNTAAYRNTVRKKFLSLLESCVRNNGRITNLIIHLLEDNAFKQFSHARHVRFGDYVWDLDKGLECFQGNAFCEQTLTATFKAGKVIAEEYKSKENTLKNIRSKSHEIYEISALTGIVQR